MSWPDWLGYGKGRPPLPGITMAYLPFQEARAAVRALGLRSEADWMQWCIDGNRPADIPSFPDLYYKGEGWLSWPDWLGYERHSFQAFEAARDFVLTHNLKSQKEWEAWCKESDPGLSGPAACTACAKVDLRFRRP